MQPDDDANEQARQALQEQGAGNELEDEQIPADAVNGDADLGAPGQPGGVTEDGGDVGGRPSEDGDADADMDEADAGHDHDNA